MPRPGFVGPSSGGVMIDFIDSLFNLYFPSYVFDFESIFLVPLYFMIITLFFGLFIKFFRGFL